MPVVTLPALHDGQVRALLAPGRFKTLRCGRRWGKTVVISTIACDGAAKGQNIGIFAPDYKILAETYAEIRDILEPIEKSASKIEGVIRTTTGGRIDFWTLENERAGRSRKYHKVLIDEASFSKPNMMRIWETAIKPALLDYRGSALVASTPNGSDSQNFFWRLCNEPEHGFTEFHAPTHTNPFLPVDELALLQEQNHPMVFRQEYLAEFVDWSGSQFFETERCLVDGEAVEFPTHIDAVFATIDTATKTGKDHDGTAVMFWGFNRSTRKVYLLDWDLVQIEGALLEVWLPLNFARLEELAVLTKARLGSLGTYIEDKNSGSVLIQQSIRRNLPARGIDSKLTSLGKDERCISVSGYVHQMRVLLTKHAYNKTLPYKGQTRNHMLSQVFGYRLGVKDQADDLLDCFTYGIAIALGNSGGF